MSQDTDITDALEERLFDTDGIPDDRHRDTPNQKYEIDDRFAESWMRVRHFFGTETVTTLPAAGARLEIKGFTQVDFYVPLETGTRHLDDLCDRTKQRFPGEVTKLPVNGRTLHVTMSRRWGARRDAKWWTDHVDIEWTFGAVNPLS